VNTEERSGFANEKREGNCLKKHCRENRRIFMMFGDFSFSRHQKSGAIHEKPLENIKKLRKILSK
jgi:hypothetical protein